MWNLLHYGMFVRWQRRTSIASWNWRKPNAGARLSAVLVESVRINGRPKQRHVAFLAGIAEDRINDSMGQLRFWETALSKLDSLSNRVSADDRARIESAIAERVPRPSKQALERFRQERRAMFGPDWK